MKCFRCQKQIAKNSHYNSFTEFNLGSVVNVDYAHKECWDEYESE